MTRYTSRKGRNIPELLHETVEGGVASNLAAVVRRAVNDLRAALALAHNRDNKAVLNHRKETGTMQKDGAGASTPPR